MLYIIIHMILRFLLSLKLLFQWGVQWPSRPKQKTRHAHPLQISQPHYKADNQPFDSTSLEVTTVHGYEFRQRHSPCVYIYVGLMTKQA